MKHVWSIHGTPTKFKKKKEHYVIVVLTYRVVNLYYTFQKSRVNKLISNFKKIFLKYPVFHRNGTKHFFTYNRYWPDGVHG